MKKIAVLGPEGTFSDLAAQMYLKSCAEQQQLIYYPTICKTISAMDADTDAIVPFENVLDGFVTETLDTIYDTGCLILKQWSVPIAFRFVGHADSMDAITDVYVQEKAYGQCLDFLKNYDFTIHLTKSNTESYRACKNTGQGAVIPVHLPFHAFNLVRKIQTGNDNRTRFVYLSRRMPPVFPTQGHAFVAITAKKDRPGLLYDIIKDLHHLNMRSILSRPNKKNPKKAIFFIEIELKQGQRDLLHSFIEKQNTDEVDSVLLGIYR